MKWSVVLAAGLMLATGIASVEAATPKSAQKSKGLSGVAAFYDTNYKGATAVASRLLRR